MRRSIFLLFLLLGLTKFALAQEDGEAWKNAVITHSERSFKFVKGNSANPVQIKEESVKTYSCISYRTNVQVAEFYNNQELIDEVNIEVDGSRKHGISPRYENYNSDGIFYSDSKVCYFNLPLVKKGSSSEVKIKRTTLDPRYFTSIFFTDDLLIEDQTVRVFVPSWMKAELKPFNFTGYDIKISREPKDDGIEYVYTMHQLPAYRPESSAPGITYLVPHIMVLCQSAEGNTYFKTVKEQYAWYHGLVEDADAADATVKAKAEELSAGLASDEEKVKKIFQWVQDNIRYIAFEDGIAGFKPEKASEVLRKKYGDCKGMANLLTVMLRSIKLDARRCWIGTKHIAYDYSTPSLSVDNHMICAWMKNGKPVFLDGTEKYIGYGELAERIQGRQTLMENGGQYLLERVPVSQYLQNTATETRKLSMKGSDLAGHVVQTWKGENKEWLLSSLHSIRQNKQEDALREYLAGGKSNYEITNFTVINLLDYNKDLKVEYDINWKNAVTEFGSESYIELNNRRDLERFKFDSSKRKLPYWFHFKDHLVFESELSLPADKSIQTMPEKMELDRPGYSFKGSCTKNANGIAYRTEIILKQTEFKPSDFAQWNKDIDSLLAFYDQQIVLINKK